VRFWTLFIFLAATVSVFAPRHSGGQTPASGQPPFAKDSSYIGPDGTAYVQRVVPVPDTISPAAQHALAKRVSDAPAPQTVEENRKSTLVWQTSTANAAKAKYPLKSIKDSTIAGVPVLVLTPNTIPADRQKRVLINLHGGGFVVDAGSLTETIPIANLTQTKVIAVLYRLAPEHPYPAALDDAIAVYKEVLKTNKPGEVAIYGTSAGAILTAQVAAKIKQLGLPMPAALGIFSGLGDFSRNGDSRSLYALGGLSGHLDAPKKSGESSYLGEQSRKDPIISPMFSNLHGMPPTLFVTSERDMLLSGTINLHRAYLRAGVDARLVVFEGLGHAFWNNPEFPESTEANKIMADFFDKNLGK
jgi:monoterpene epsilon-lactone hydrolase